MIDFKREIALAVEKAVPELKLEEALRFLEQPPDRKLGDFALPCFKFSPLLKKSPQEIALELEKKILLPKSVERMQAVGGFLNFFLKQEVMISETLGNVLKEGKNPFINLGFTHDTSDFNNGVVCSSYKLLGTMQEKVQHQMELVEKLRAADTSDTARLILDRHFIRDMKGNLRNFSLHEDSCNRKK